MGKFSKSQRDKFKKWQEKEKAKQREVSSPPKLDSLVKVKSPKKLQELKEKQPNVKHPGVSSPPKVGSPPVKVNSPQSLKAFAFRTDNWELLSSPLSGAPRAITSPSSSVVPVNRGAITSSSPSVVPGNGRLSDDHLFNDTVLEDVERRSVPNTNQIVHILKKRITASQYRIVQSELKK